MAEISPELSQCLVKFETDLIFKMTVGMDEDELDFKRMWSEAEERFKNTTKKSLVQSRNLSLDDVLRTLDERFRNQDPDEGGKSPNFKNLALNVLKIIELLGGIAAQGASLIFGPANLCFNAMDYLISIPARISKFYDVLGKLFEEISTFLKKFKIYQRIEQYAVIDIELKRSTHELMIVFIDICALSINVLSGSKWQKGKLLAKEALFDDGSGIQAKLDEFKRLIDQQSQISDAVTLEYVLSSEAEHTSSMKKVFDTLKFNAEESRQQLEVRSQRLESVVRDTGDDVVRSVRKFAEAASDREKQRELLEQACRTLSIDPDTPQTMERDLDQTRKDILPNTGSWLEDLDLFKSWINLESQSNVQLLLSGSPGSGKSFLACAIADKMKSRISNTSSNLGRVLTAFCPFKKNEKSSRDGVKESVKSMAAQMAYQDLPYLKTLHQYLEPRDLTFASDMGIKDLIEEFISPRSSKSSLNISFVLVFDGLDQLPNGEAQQLFAACLDIALPNVKILLTGTEDIFKFCSELSERELDSMPLIRIADHSGADIERFLDIRLKKSEVLQGDAPDIREIVDRMQQRIPDIVNGSFEDLRHIVEEVEKGVKSEDRLEDIQKLVSEDTLKNKDAVVEKLINNLNHSLTIQEIEQLNEILIWTIYAFESVSVDQMEAAVFLRTKRTPLQSLKNKMDQKYSGLLQISEDGHFEMRNGHLEEFFRKSKREKPETDVEARDDPKISMTIKIDHVKLSKVQRFLWDLSEKVVLDKFLFTDPRTSPTQSVAISASSVDAHLTLAKRCFDLLLEDPHEKTKEIVPYALMYLPRHLSILSQNVDDESPEPAEKENIVENLVSLLQSPNYVEKHLTEGFLLWGGWVDEEQAIQGWLSDPEATSKLNRNGRIWLKQATSGRLTALRDVAIMIARHWLCDRRWPAIFPFRWIDSYLDQLASESGQGQITNEPQDRATRDHDPEPEITDKGVDEPGKKAISIHVRVNRATKWAENEAKFTKSSLWYERLGHTYLNEEEWELSKIAFLDAKKAPDSSWKASEGLAEAQAASNDKQSAIQELEIAISCLREKGDLSVEERSDLVKNIVKIARWQVELQNITDATAKLNEAIGIDEQQYTGHYELIKLFVETNQESEALTLLDGMRMQPAKDTLTKLETMLSEFSNRDDSFECFQTIINMTRHHDMSAALVQILEKLLGHARSRNATSSVIDLLHWHGVALAHDSPKEEHLEMALTQWIKCCELFSWSNTEDKYDYLVSAIHFAFNLHFSRTKLKSGTAKDFEILINEIQDLTKGPKMYHARRIIRYPLGSLYCLSGNQDSAQKLLRDDMKAGLDILSDDDPDNDIIGYYRIANVLMHTGDDLNAMSAWSLYGSWEHHNEEFSMPLYCDGCSKIIVWADSICACKICADVQFHDECLKRLQRGTLGRFVCSSDHEWLHVQSWVDERKSTGKGHVRIGGELRDGKQIGGDIVPAETWLTMIKEKWKFENQLATVPNEDEKKV